MIWRFSGYSLVRIGVLGVEWEGGEVPLVWALSLSVMTRGEEGSMFDVLENLRPSLFF